MFIAFQGRRLPRNALARGQIVPSRSDAFGKGIPLGLARRLLARHVLWRVWRERPLIQEHTIARAFCSNESTRHRPIFALDNVY